MTTPENQNPQELEPFFPPILLLGVAAVSLFIAFLVRFTQSEWNILGIAGIAVGVISLIAWLVMNPQEAKNFVTGRALSYGGTAVLVSVGVIAAAILIYAVIASQNWVKDYTAGSVLTVADNTRDVLETLGSDPTSGNIHLVGFFNSQNATGQERIEILLRDFESLSNGKITYEFVDPDRQPQVAQLYSEAVRSGQFAVVPYDVDGNLLYEESEIVSNADQYSLINMVIETLAGGDFRAVILQVPEGVDPADTSEQGGSYWENALRSTRKWDVEIMSPLDIASQAGLGEIAADGDVLIIPGGTTALPDEAIANIEDYVNRGGNIILLAGTNLTPDPTLASADNMSAFLESMYGVSVRNDLVVDDAEHFTLPVQLLADSYISHPITDFVIENDLLTVFSTAQSIAIAETPPDNVTISELVLTTDKAYAKTGLDLNEQFANNVTQEDYQAYIAQNDDDISGVLALGVAVENSTNNSRLVVFGSDMLMWNALDGLRGDANRDLMRDSITWTTRFSDFSASLARIQNVTEIPQDQVNLTVEDYVYIRLVTLILLPLGALLVGVAVWWARRDEVSN